MASRAQLIGTTAGFLVIVVGGALVQFSGRDADRVAGGMARVTPFDLAVLAGIGSSDAASRLVSRVLTAVCVGFVSPKRTS